MPRTWIEPAATNSPRSLSKSGGQDPALHTGDPLFRHSRGSSPPPGGAESIFSWQPCTHRDPERGTRPRATQKGSVVPSFPRKLAPHGGAESIFSRQPCTLRDPERGTRPRATRKRIILRIVFSPPRPWTPAFAGVTVEEYRQVPAFPFTLSLPVLSLTKGRRASVHSSSGASRTLTTND